MVAVLENNWLHFSLDPQQAAWSLHHAASGWPELLNARLGVFYYAGLARFHALESWPAVQLTAVEKIPSPVGELQQLSVLIEADSRGLCYRLHFALLEQPPLFLWQLTVENMGHQPVFLERLELMRLGQAAHTTHAAHKDRAAPDALRSEIRGLSGSPAFFSNGWQSWSYAGAYGPGERFRHTRLGSLRVPTDVNEGTPLPGHPGDFASDMYGVLGDRQQRSGFLAGFLSQQQHFGSLEAHLTGSAPALRLWANGDRARLDPGQQTATDWACIQFVSLDDPDPLRPYLETVARWHGLQPDEPAHASRLDIPAGWCSWYQFSSEGDYTGAVTAADIRDNIQAVQTLRPRLPLDVIQIDDGFEAQIGDWGAFSPGFPQGVAPLAQEIRRAGFTPGLWLAPFIVHPKSHLATLHPDWLLLSRKGRRVNAGFLWGAFTTALDLTHPGVLEYVANVIHTAAQEWGFAYLKLDFLYAAALPGQYRDITRTRAQVLRSGLEAVRQAAGAQTTLLGCGCPLGPAIGLVDCMRIGADTARRWAPSFQGIEIFIKGEPNLPAARNASHNALTRSALHRRWWVNDPDCLLLRSTTHLTLEEVQTLASVVALTGGSVFLSDHLPDLPPERLQIAEALLPVIGQRPQVIDWFDATKPRRVRLDLEGAAGDWHLLALFNWEDQAQELFLDLKDFRLETGREYWVRDFWRNEITRTTTGLTRLVPAHGVILLAARQVSAAVPQYAGSSLHISQGLEVQSWEIGRDGLFWRLERPGPAEGMVDLALPRAPGQVMLNGERIAWESLSPGLYRLRVAFTHVAQFHYCINKSEPYISSSAFL